MELVSLGFLLVLSISSTIRPVVSISPALLLTPYLNQSKVEEARKLSLINPALFLNVTSYSGLLTVDAKYNSNTFFWFFPVERQPMETAPWIIWLQGGPGVSSLAGLFDEIGPLEYSNGMLQHRKYSWTKNHSVLFIDNPVGVGYSFTDSEDGYATDMTIYSAHLYGAVQQFLTLFPELRKAPLFIAGESYAGRYVPALATRIKEAAPFTDDTKISLEGLILGNPVLTRQDVVNITAVYYQWGMIDSQGVLAVKPLQDLYYDALRTNNNTLASYYRDKLLDKLLDITMMQQEYNPLADTYKLEDFENFLAKEDVREALHVGLTEYRFRNETVRNKLVADFLTDANEMIEELLDKYEVLIYCGQLDLVAPCVPYAEARRKEWRWTKRDEFLNAPRVPWWYNESVAGYVKKGGGFMEVLVRGAGHLAPVDKPAQVLQLITSFIQDIEMELPPNYELNKEDTPLFPTHQTSNVTIVNTTTEKIEANTKENNASKASNDSKPIVKPNEAKNQISSAAVGKEAVESSISVGTIVSIALNILLVLVVASVAFLYMRLRRKTEDFFYNNIETNSDDLFLT